MEFASSKPKEVKLDVSDQKVKLSNISKMLAKKATSREALTSAEYISIKKAVKLANGVGLRMVEKQQTVEALDLLKQAENVAQLLLRVVEQNPNAQATKATVPVLKMLSNTYNNIGYLFSQAGNMENAYTYLVKTLDAETRGEFSSYHKGLTCLNLANILVSKETPENCR